MKLLAVIVRGPVRGTPEPGTFLLCLEFLAFAAVLIAIWNLAWKGKR